MNMPVLIEAPIEAVGTSMEIRRRLELSANPADRRRLLELIEHDPSHGRIRAWIYALRKIPYFEADVEGRRKRPYRVRLTSGVPQCQCEASARSWPDTWIGCRHMLAAIEQAVFDEQAKIEFPGLDVRDPFERIEA